MVNGKPGSVAGEESSGFQLTAAIPTYRERLFSGKLIVRLCFGATSPWSSVSGFPLLIIVRVVLCCLA